MLILLQEASAVMQGFSKAAGNYIHEWVFETSPR